MLDASRRRGDCGERPLQRQELSLDDPAPRQRSRYGCRKACLCCRSEHAAASAATTCGTKTNERVNDPAPISCQTLMHKRNVVSGHHPLSKTRALGAAFHRGYSPISAAVHTRSSRWRSTPRSPHNSINTAPTTQHAKIPQYAITLSPPHPDFLPSASHCSSRVYIRRASSFLQHKDFQTMP